MKNILVFGATINLLLYTSVHLKKLNKDVQTKFDYLINYSYPVYSQLKKK